MSASDVVKTVMTALESNEKDTVDHTLADAFMCYGWTPKPLNKQGFMQVIEGLKSGIPGLIFNLHNVSEEENTVHATWQVAGYQTDSFILPVLSLPPIPQMGKSINLPAEEVDFNVENEQVTRMTVHHVPGGSIRGLLQQLGTDAPIIQ